MARLPTSYQGPANHEDIIQILHDEVVSLCQKNYNTVAGLEIDGIICISILDTKEQQVVKIHKTLKSVFAEDRKKAKLQKTSQQPSCWLRGNSDVSVFPGEPNGNTTSENFQNDINVLSNLLRDTNAAICRELEEKSGVESKQSKRKRKQPKQRITNSIEPVNEKNETENTVLEQINNAPITEESSVAVANSPGINPFIHKDVIKVKEEKVDPEYESAEHSKPKIVSISSLAKDNEEDNSEPPGNVIEQTKISSIIDRLIEKEIPMDRDADINNKYQERESEDSQDKTDICNGEEFQAIEVKVEKMDDESEYGGSQYDKEEITGANSDNAGTGGSNSDTENFVCPQDWLYNEHASLSSVGKNALLDKLQETGTLALKGYPREVGRAESDPQGRSWIEMVKDNVNKYQAALQRSAKVRSEVENDNKQTNSGTVQTSQLAKSSSSLVALLKQPAANLTKPKEVTTNAFLDSLRNSRGSSVPIQGTDQIPERSSSVSPVVKIEVDDDMTHEIYSQSDSEVNGDNISRNPKIETAKDGKPTPTKAPPGKLESRYPALFSHLQQDKQTNVDNQDQADSLVNRLPFISFQELFSQAPTGQPATRLSESTTRQLLAQARINPYPSKEKNKAPRKVWNWKKRQVRPRDADGKIISPIPVKLKNKKTFSKRGEQSEKEIDKDWQPEADVVDQDSDNNDIVTNTVDPDCSLSRRTRLSCGEKPRINFAELDNSDIEMEEEEEEDIDTNSVTMRKQFTKLQAAFSDRQGEKSSMFAGCGSEQLLAAFSARSEQLNIASNSTAEQYKCSLCGLEFNQEYRWHYHLIKVHGITAEKIKLFR